MSVTLEYSLLLLFLQTFHEIMGNNHRILKVRMIFLAKHLAGNISDYVLGLCETSYSDLPVDANFD